MLQILYFSSYIVTLLIFFIHNQLINAKES